MAKNIYDAIVVGSGISGGWAAMELCKKGLKVLLLERGRNVAHITDYPTAIKDPWEFKDRSLNSCKEYFENPIRAMTADESDRLFFAADKEYPFIQEKPFNWSRGYQVGGRSLTWGRQCYRLSDLDFEANLKEGIAVDWPIRYKDIAPWYSYVERFVGVSGSKDQLTQLPDGDYLPPMELNTIERYLAASLRKNDEKRLLTIARVANLTQAWGGRGPCMNRNLCSRGCPYGGYFSSNSATIPAAAATGNLTLRPYSVVCDVMFDQHSQKATGVRVIDSQDYSSHEFFSRIIFLNASTINTASILLNSTSARFPNGMGNDSGELGHNLMDHHSSAGAYGVYHGFAGDYYKGRRPCGFIIPRFNNLDQAAKTDYLRGYNLQGVGRRQEWQDRYQATGFGQTYKEQLTKPGPWMVWMAGWGECLPYHDNKVSLSYHEKDKWGMPLTSIRFEFKQNEEKMMIDIENSAAEILKNANFEGIQPFNYNHPGGSTVHEMGTARMGRDPKTSVLNANNQLHSVKNVFVTDGSCMTSSACQNPSLTYMALTARACDFAIVQMKKGEL